MTILTSIYKMVQEKREWRLGERVEKRIRELQNNVSNIKIDYNTSQEELKRIALFDTNYWRRKYAIGMLNDVSTISLIKSCDKDPEVKKSARKRFKEL